ncbi:Cof-type HAD-IIB family hydrolase [Spiroplasma endosymbiont of Panzeria rudis]|uniref:Cof-type HAD-IIB family hydrolase n=1 Tax=Spiroplasma endosymbiont of Panzeria rudis TaxID=3066301 RepID=UPI0030CD3D55
MSLYNKKQKHLILVDLDGTLLKSGGREIHINTKKALIDAQKQGHIVCIVTGRPYRGSIKFYRELGLNTLLCNFNGGHIHDPKIKKFKRLVFPISETIVKHILNEDYIFQQIENAVIEYYNKAVCWKKDDFFETYFHLDTIENDTFTISKLIRDWKGSANAILIEFKENTNLDQVYRNLEKYSNSIKVNTWNRYDNNKLIFEISSKFIDKGMTARILAQYYNVDIRDVIAYGDEINDKEMLMEVGYGVAMKNGNIVIKSIANDITTKTNDEGGVGDHLAKLLNLYEESEIYI